MGIILEIQDDHCQELFVERKSDKPMPPVLVFDRH